MKLWVVTGGIGTGKSSFCEAMHRGVPAGDLHLVSADQIVHEAYEILEIRQSIAKALGMAFDASVEGNVFRHLVRDVIRRSEQMRRKLERILHPIVWERRQMIAKEAELRGVKVLVAEIPLYYESAPAFAVDLVIVVAASMGLQVSRLHAKRALDARASQDMLAMQMPLEYKIERADVIVWNDGSVSALENQAHLLLRQANLL